MWRGPNLSNGDMMQEVLELLATGSQSSKTASSSVDSNVDSSNNMDESINANVSHDCDDGCSGNETLGSVGALPMRLVSMTSDDEEKHAAVPVQTESQELKEEALGVAQQMPNPTPDMVLQLSQSVATSQLVHSIQQPAIHPPQSVHSAAQQYFAGDPGRIASAATGESFNTPAHISPCYPPPSAQILETFPVPPVQTLSQRNPSQPAATTGGLPSNVLPTGQRVRVMNSVEFDELRRKLRMQTASRRYRKRKKESNKQQKAEIQALQAELTRLQQIEARSKLYEQRSVESLEQELKMNQAEVAELSGKLADAAKEELHWMNMMKSHLRK